MFFKYFYENYNNLTEAEGNLGDFSEPIFAIGLFHYIKKDLSKDSILNTLKSISQLPYENTYGLPGFQILLKLEGKENIQNIFGSNFQNISPMKQQDILKIIDSVVKHIPQLKTIKKVDQFVETHMVRSLRTHYVLKLSLSGSKTAQQEDVKGDVILEIISKTQETVPEDIKKISYSVKYGGGKSEFKIAETAIFNVILRLSNTFHLPMTNGLNALKNLPRVIALRQLDQWNDDPLFNQYKKQSGHLMYFVNMLLAKMNNITKPSPEALEEIRISLKNAFLNEFNNEMSVKERKQPDFSQKAYSFLEKEIFGQDLSDVVIIDIGNVSEINMEKYEEIKKEYLVDFDLKTFNKNDILRFDIVKNDGRFPLFWIENHTNGTVQVKVGNAILK
jgi:hypothetical protein